MGAYVKYVGTAGVRMITAEDWKAAGVKDMGTVVWQAANGFTVPKSIFSEAAWPFVVADTSLIEVASEPVEAGAPVSTKVTRERVRTGSSGLLDPVTDL